jgi:phosphoribosyl 1,2-cyclic phosphodiesterase
MPLFISSLNSGSNGNCYYIGNETEAILVDAGISCRETERRMNRCGLSMDKVKAVFVSHEHTDHISGLRVLSKKYRLPVYITDRTEQLCNLGLDRGLTRRFHPGEAVLVGGLAVTAFQKRHDAADPHSFIVASSSVKVGVFTDIGFACRQVIHHFQQCHAAFLEANYDPDMLRNGNYPYHLKRRISDGSGHLSNNQALELFLEHRPSFMSHLVLSHLSKNNNRPELVNQLFQPHAAGTNIIVASRYAPTEVYHVDGSWKQETLLLRPRKKTGPKQLTLF